MKLQGKRVAILATDGFEQSELVEPAKALEAEGATVEVVSPKEGTIRGWSGENWASDPVKVSKLVSQASVDDYHALLLPGGVANPDSLRTDENAVSFVRDFFTKGKPVASICHGPSTMINAGVVEGRKVTSYPSIRKDLENAGAEWIDAPVVTDHGLVTSRHPGDLKPFCEKMIEEIAEGKHKMQSTLS
jgi:protease I